MAHGDFNGDGNVDLAVGNSSDGTLTILLGDGKGSFTSVPASFAGYFPQGLAVGDFDGDGIPDLAVTIGSRSFGILTPVEYLARGRSRCIRAHTSTIRLDGFPSRRGIGGFQR